MIHVYILLMTVRNFGILILMKFVHVMYTKLLCTQCKGVGFLGCLVVLVGTVSSIDYGWGQ